jgi:hypothetical protein
MPDIALSSNEIEVACDALWFLKQNGHLSEAGSCLWDRLQPHRTGDHGHQQPAVALSTVEQHLVKTALDLVDADVGMDPEERALSNRLSHRPG